MIRARTLIVLCCLAAGATCAEGAEVTFREGGGSGYVGLKWDVVSIITTSEFDPDNPVNDSDWASGALGGSACPLALFPL